MENKIHALREEGNLRVLPENKSEYKREFLAGTTSFLAMAYIIAVNPSILSAAGMPAGAIVTATCISAVIGCLIMGFYAKLPFGLAPGMGLNAFFTFSVVIGMGISWEVALTAVFVEGLIFILLSLFKVREAVVDAIPINLKYAVTAGIGLFIAFIGFNGAGVVIGNPDTMVAMGQVGPKMLIAMVGLCIIVILEKKKVKGSMLVGIVVSTLLAWGYALINTEAAASMGIYLPNGIFKFESIAPIAGKVNFSYLTSPQHVFNFITIVFTFLFVDFFDTVGTLIGVASRANMLDKKGRVPNAGKALMTDAIATTAGALLGTSTVTVYVESATGVEEGGRTGLTAITIGALFFVAMFFSPIFVAVPACATAPALIYVGYLMLTSVLKIDFSDITDAVPAFLIIALMPLTYSIGDGLTIGVLAYVILNILHNIFTKNKKDKKELSMVMIVLAIIFVIKLCLPLITQMIG
ncbi:NCS2 family permease [Clostridium perfringens]|uniref:Xanthine/uracil permease family protein n=1 Tax=Clostridium perfringens E str. JGS1987 TaxID=451755 RepID=B1BW97_CLOPF|nr:NCS2 family permease [Clostridium perfringens]ALG49318.1 Xanthine/uracil/thiamine/ascorbate permease family protein [Clostridium perfringens]EDT14024.1 xanthine/uracil permease family protein [Clostridium perfringens E str. JGS1987]EHK2305509.1 NCS2 family permease [Clostridium perfringens]EHK2387475.1 NCS2 family permease [Clostridium perfringens]EHK2402463.1 NCS2 family permease [Clostridium perfringens]